MTGSQPTTAAAEEADHYAEATSTTCMSCKKEIASPQRNVFFQCGHAYHSTCGTPLVTCLCGVAVKEYGTFDWRVNRSRPMASREVMALIDETWLICIEQRKSVEKTAAGLDAVMKKIGDEMEGYSPLWRTYAEKEAAAKKLALSIILLMMLVAEWMSIVAFVGMGIFWISHPSVMAIALVSSIMIVYVAPSPVSDYFESSKVDVRLCFLHLLFLFVIPMSIKYEDDPDLTFKRAMAWLAVLALNILILVAFYARICVAWAARQRVEHYQSLQ